MPTATVSKDQDAIVSEIEISAPPERVFQALIDSKQLMQWWNSEQCRSKSWQIEPRKGGRWHYETEPSTLVVNGVSEFKVGGEILEYDPPRLLAYSWIANWHDDPHATTVVRWELYKAGGGTRVKVTHSGLSNQPVSRKDYSGGWPGVVESLKKFVES